MENITINLHSISYSDCKYPILRNITRTLNWSSTDSEDISSSDLIWHDCSIPPDRLASLKLYQKVNHFPGMSGIFRKNSMANNLNRFRKLYPKDYNFYPRTWVLPGELNSFKQALKPRKKTFIVKPEASSQGQGIYLARQISDLKDVNHCIAQEYLENPLLIDNLKFDMRIYVLVTGCDPLRIFIHEEGLARFATTEYTKPSKSNMKDVYVHLTNYSINKNNPNFVQASEGKKSHKRSMSSVLIQLSELGIDVEEIWDNICDIIVKTLLMIQPSLASTYRTCQPYDYSNSMCFEILGFDVILDSNFKPWLLEVNHSPSFSTDSELDLDIKSAVISEALALVNINEKKKKEYLAETKKMNRHRSLSSRSIKPSKEEKMIRVIEEIKKRDLFEDQHTKGFIKLYPGSNDLYYEKFFKTAECFFYKLSTPKRPNSSFRLQEDEDCEKKGETLGNVSAMLAKRRAAWS